MRGRIRPLGPGPALVFPDAVSTGVGAVPDSPVLSHASPQAARPTTKRTTRGNFRMGRTITHKMPRGRWQKPPPSQGCRAGSAQLPLMQMASATATNVSLNVLPVPTQAAAAPESPFRHAAAVW